MLQPLLLSAVLLAAGVCVCALTHSLSRDGSALLFAIEVAITLTTAATAATATTTATTTEGTAATAATIAWRAEHEQHQNRASERGSLRRLLSLSLMPRSRMHLTVSSTTVLEVAAVVHREKRGGEWRESKRGRHSGSSEMSRNDWDASTTVQIDQAKSSDHNGWVNDMHRSTREGPHQFSASLFEDQQPTTIPQCLLIISHARRGCLGLPQSLPHRCAVAKRCEHRLSTRDAEKTVEIAQSNECCVCNQTANGVSKQ